jgi:nucleotide-binding universal stress UspA family protein
VEHSLSDKRTNVVVAKRSYIEKATTYLADLKGKLETEGVKVQTEVLEGVPREAITDYAKGNDVDLIVIGTHGYTGMKKLMFGSVALRVLHDAHSPVLLIRPESCW